MSVLTRRVRRKTDTAKPVSGILTAWRVYALASLIPLLLFADILAGPGSQRPFAPLKGVDFGAFYGEAMLVREGRARQLGNMDAQRDVQRRLQERERTEWNWYDALPHPPIAGVIIAPLAWLRLRTAFWVFAGAGLVAAALAAWVLARGFCPRAPIAAALILFAFEPIWDVAWWGQIDSFLLLPAAIGSVMLIRDQARDHDRDLLAGALIGMLALKPIFVPLPLLVLAWGRHRAALGMLLSGAVLGLGSLAIVGPRGVRDYIELSRYYGRFSGSPMIVEWRMYNLRGMAIRLDLGGSDHVRLVLVLAVSAVLALLTLIITGRALRSGRAPDLALGAVVLGMLITAYHLHVQSLVYLLVPLAIWMGRSLAAKSILQALLWSAPVVTVQGGAAFLRPDKPSPSPAESGLETYLTACLILLLIASLVILAASRRLQATRNSTK